MTPIYNYLMVMGYEPKDEFVIIEGWAVQFLPVYDSLTEEALEQAIQVGLAQLQQEFLRLNIW